MRGLRFIGAGLLAAYAGSAWADTTVTLQPDQPGSYSVQARDLEVRLTVEPEEEGFHENSYTIVEKGQPVFTSGVEALYSLYFGPHFRVVEMDADNDQQEVFMSVYSGGAHCCALVSIFTKTPDGWRERDAGAFDGDGEGLYPQDLDGDGLAEIQSYDNRFLYTFAPYAASFAPPMIIGMRGSEAVDVTREEKYRYVLKSAFDDLPERPESGEALNSWLAMRAALRLRLGDGEMQDIIAQADSEADTKVNWGMERCPNGSANLDECAETARITIGFGQALSEFLDDIDYMEPAN